MMAEVYCANLWKREILATPPITEMSKDLLQKISGRAILIVGGYFRQNMDAINKSAKSVFVYESEEKDSFISWTIDALSKVIPNPITFKICQFLEEYLYGDPSEDSLNFQNGIYCLDGRTDQEKLESIQDMADIRRVLEKGSERRIANKRTAEHRLTTAVPITIKLDGSEYKALVAIGDSPIVDTCIVLAQNSPDGFGILYRYDLFANKTFMTCRSTTTSKVHAGKYAQEWSGGSGGGTKICGGASITGLVFPSK